MESSHPWACSDQPLHSFDPSASNANDLQFTNNLQTTKMSIPQVDGSSSAKQPSANNLNTQASQNGWFAAEHNFGINNSSSRSNVKTHAEMQASRPTWGQVHASFTAMQAENVKPKATWTQASATFVSESKEVIKPKSTWGQATLTFESAQAAKNGSAAIAGRTTATESHVASSSNVAENSTNSHNALHNKPPMARSDRVADNNQLPTDSKAAVEKPTWGDVSAKFNMKSCEDYGRTEQGRPTSAVPMWTMAQAAQHMQRNLPKGNAVGEGEYTTQVAQQASHINTATKPDAGNNIKSFGMGGQLANSRWAVTKATINVGQPQTLQQANAPTFASAMTQDSVNDTVDESSPAPNKMKTNQAFTWMGSTTRQSVPNLTPYNAAAAPFQPRDQSQSQRQSTNSWSAAIPSTLPNNNPLPPHLQLSANKPLNLLPPNLTTSTAGVHKDAVAVHKHEPDSSKSTSFVPPGSFEGEKEVKDVASVFSRSSGLMNSRWAPRGKQLDNDPVRELKPKTPSLRPDVPPFQTASGLSSQIVELYGVDHVSYKQSTQVPRHVNIAPDTRTVKAAPQPQQVTVESSKTTLNSDFIAPHLKAASSKISVIAKDEKVPEFESQRSFKMGENKFFHSGQYEISPYPWSGPDKLPKEAAVYNPSSLNEQVPLPGPNRTSHPAASLQATNKSSSQSVIVSAADRINQPISHCKEQGAAPSMFISKPEPPHKEQKVESANTSVPLPETSKDRTSGRPLFPHELVKTVLVAPHASKTQPVLQQKNVASPTPSEVAIVALQNKNTVSQSTLQASMQPGTKDGVPVLAGGSGEQLSNKLPPPFDPNKYGKPLKASAPEAETSRSVRKFAPLYNFDPNTLKTNHFMEQMDQKRAQNPSGKIYQRIGPTTTMEDDKMFGDRAGVKIWTEDPTTGVNPDVAKSAASTNLEHGATSKIVPKTFPISADTAFMTGSAERLTGKSMVEKPINADALNTIDKEEFNKRMIADLKSKRGLPPGPSGLTSHQLAVATGERIDTRSCKDSLEDKISDAGIQKEGIRANFGVSAADELLDFDGSRLPAPVDWESRRSHDNAHSAAYIKEWSTQIRLGPSVVNTTQPEFLEGQHPIEEEGLKPPILHDTTHPLDPSKNEPAKHPATAQDAIAKAKAKRAMQFEDNVAESRVNALEARHRRAQEAEQNPFAPTTSIYLRAAIPHDAAGIVAIYNHYVEHSHIPEDQRPVNIQTFARIIDNCKKNELPFIVAVAGSCPPTADALGRLPKSNGDVILPQHEVILGFAFAEFHNFGIAGLSTGRSRCNAVLQLYVDHEHQHKGVGRNLLDRMMHVVSDAYAHRNAVEWLSPPAKISNIYDSSKASKWHVLFFHVPMESKDSPRFARTVKFLNYFRFRDYCVLDNAVRTSTLHGAAKFMDLAVFQGVALPTDAFNPFS